jgi:hypothetical protein
MNIKKEKAKSRLHNLLPNALMAEFGYHLYERARRN